MREIMFDVETTGLFADQGDRIIEIGAVEVVNFMPTGNVFQAYLDPGRSVSKRLRLPVLPMKIWSVSLNSKTL